MDGRWSSLLSFVLSLFLSENKRKHMITRDWRLYQEQPIDMAKKDFISQSDLKAKPCTIGASMGKHVTGRKRVKTFHYSPMASAGKYVSNDELKKICNWCKAPETMQPAKCAGKHAKAKWRLIQCLDSGWLERLLIVPIVYTRCPETFSSDKPTNNTVTMKTCRGSELRLYPLFHYFLHSYHLFQRNSLILKGEVTIWSLTSSIRRRGISSELR